MSRLMTLRQRSSAFLLVPKRTAYHEMGHALVASSLPGVDPIQKVSIVPRGVGALGYTIQRPTEDRFLLAASDLENRVAVLMGGRAAEKLVFAGNISTGAADDLQRATEIAVEMVTKHGMDETIGQRTYAPSEHPFLPGAPAERMQAAEATAREIDLAVRDIIARAFERATAILQRRRDDLDAGVELLLTRETLTANDFPAIRPMAGASEEEQRLAVAPNAEEAIPSDSEGVIRSDRLPSGHPVGFAGLMSKHNVLPRCLAARLKIGSRLFGDLGS